MAWSSGGAASCLLAVLFSSFFFTTTVAANGLATINQPPYIPSACFGFRLPVSGDLSAAANENTLWNGGHACGKKFRVRCTGATNAGVPHPCIEGASVVVTVVDKCPASGPCNGDLDIAHAAFTTIADPLSGKIHIDYESVD